MALGQSFRDSGSQVVNKDSDRLGCIVVRRDREIHFIRIAVCIDQSERLDTQTLGFSQRDVLVSDVDQEQSSGYATQLSDTAQYFFHFVFIATQSQTLFLSDAIERTIAQHFLDALHLLHALANGVEVGEHTTEPTLGDEGHVHALCALVNDVFGLFLSTDEQDLATTARDLLESGSGFLQTLNGLVQIDDVDPFLLSEDVGQHLGVPLLFQVTEMHAGFQ